SPSAGRGCRGSAGARAPARRAAPGGTPAARRRPGPPRPVRSSPHPRTLRPRAPGVRVRPDPGRPRAAGRMPAVARRTLPEAWVATWRANPGAVVLIDPSGVRVTARMLEEWSAGVARRLAAAGVGPRDRVLLSAEPSVDLVVAY